MNKIIFIIIILLITLIGSASASVNVNFGQGFEELKIGQTTLKYDSFSSMVEGVNRTRDTLFANGDFAVQYDYNGTVYFGPRNLNNGTLSSTASTVVNAAGLGLALIKHSVNYFSPNIMEIANTAGDIDYLNSAFGGVPSKMRFGFFTGINASADFTINEITGKDYVMIIENNNMSILKPLFINDTVNITNGNLNVPDGNITLGQKITFALGEIIDNIIDGWITITGNTNVIGDLNVTQNFTGNQIYGEMWFDGNGTINTLINTQDVWEPIIGFNDTGETIGQSLNGFTFDETNEWLTAQVAGKYQVAYFLSFGNVGNNQEYQTAIFINNITQQNNTDAHRKIQASGDVGNTGTTAFIDLTVGDNVSLKIKNVDGTSNVVGHASNVNLIRIGD